MSCSNCGAELTSADKFCSQCGAPAGVRLDDAECRTCKARIPSSSKFCGNCGTSDPIAKPTGATGNTVITSEPMPPAPFEEEVEEPEADDEATTHFYDKAPPFPKISPPPHAGPPSKPRVSKLPKPGEDDVDAEVTTIAPSEHKPLLPKLEPITKPPEPAPAPPPPEPAPAPSPPEPILVAPTEPPEKKPTGETAKPKSEKEWAEKPSSASLPGRRRPSPENPIAAPAGWPDITDELAEVRFFMLQGFDEDAERALNQLRGKYKGHPDLEKFSLGADQDPSSSRPAVDDADLPTAPVPVVKKRSTAETLAAVKAKMAADASVDRGPPPEPPRKPPARTGMTVVPQSKPTGGLTTPAPPGKKRITEPRTGSSKPAPSKPPPLSSFARPGPPPPPGLTQPTPVKAPFSRDALDELSSADVDVVEVDLEDESEAETTLQKPLARRDSPPQPGGWGNAPSRGQTVVGPIPEPAAGATPVEAEARAPVPAPEESPDSGSGPDEVVNVPSVPPAIELPISEKAKPPREMTQAVQTLQPASPYEDATQAAVPDMGDTLPAGEKPKITIIPDRSDRPSPPKPYGGEPPLGSTLVGGTTPPVGGFPQPSATANKVREIELPEPESPEPEPSEPESPEPELPEPELPEPELPEPELPQPPAKQQDATPPSRPLEVVPELDVPVTSAGTVVTKAPQPPAPFQGEGAKAASPEPVQPVRLVMLGARGQAVADRRLDEGDQLDVGRGGDEPWGDDTFLAPRHAMLRAAPGGGVLVEALPENGVFRQLTEREQLHVGDQVRIGQSLVTYAVESGRRELSVLNKAKLRERFPLEAKGLLVGREEGDITFPDDTYVSGEHCRVSCEGDDVFIEDLDSSNGTYIRVRPRESVGFGSLLLMGHTQFRVHPG